MVQLRNLLPDQQVIALELLYPLGIEVPNWSLKFVFVMILLLLTGGSTKKNKLNRLKYWLGGVGGGGCFDPAGTQRAWMLYECRVEFLREK